VGSELQLMCLLLSRTVLIKICARGGAYNENERLTASLNGEHITANFQKHLAGFPSDLYLTSCVKSPCQNDFFLKDSTRGLLKYQAASE
jgi:hypothetical protein